MKTHSLLLLGRRHQHALWKWPLGVTVSGLSLILVLAWAGAAPSLQLGLLATVAVVALLARLWPRRSLRETARSLDTEVGAHNRFEAMAELAGRSDALADALRTEVDDYVARHPLSRPRVWFAGLAMFAVLLVANVVLLGPGWVQSMRTPVLAAAKTEEPAKPADKAVVAELRWVTPSEEITAAPKEEVPLTLEAQSGAGLKQLTLHVARNGEPLPPIPVTSEVEPGPQLVSSALNLEALNLQPFDVVTYFARAERIRPKDMPAEASATPVSSPLQFVQIDRAGESLGGVASECTAGCLLDVVRRLKREQLGVLRGTVAAAHDPAPRTDPAWTDAVRFVATREGAIQKETAELLTQLDASIPFEATAALTLAEMETSATAKDLERIEPQIAIDPAGRALAQFAAAERALAKNIVQKRRNEKPEAEPSDLPLRETTPAGRLERVAGEQRNVVEKLALPDTAAAIGPDQDRLAREIAKLAGERAFPGEINEHIKVAAEAAKEAARQLNEQDKLAATEPATRAAQELGDAVNRLLATASARAVEDLLAAQRALIHAATKLQMADPTGTAAAAKTAAQRVSDIQQDARAAARQQQQQGSASAAQRLNELAKAIGQSNVLKDLANLEQAQPGDSAAQQKDAAARKLEHLAQAAADRASVLEDGAKSQERALDELRRTQANLDRIAKSDPSATGTNASRDFAGVVDFYEKALANAQRLANVDNRERGVPPPPGPGSTLREREAYAAMLSLRIRGLIQFAMAKLADAGRTQALTLGNPSEAPPAYRTAVADYFETLARDGSAAAAKP